MDANEYQRQAALTAAEQNDADRAANAVLGLAGEAGELAQLLIDGQWRGSVQVQHALKVIAALGSLVEPVKKVIYQGHQPPMYTEFLESLYHPSEVLRQWSDWSWAESHEGRSIWASHRAWTEGDFDHRAFADELGDAQWYVAQGARAIGWDLGIVMQGNLQKLSKRYPGGTFSAAKSKGREVPIYAKDLVSIGSPVTISSGMINTPVVEGDGIDMAGWPRFQAVDVGVAAQGDPPPALPSGSPKRLPAITGLRVVPYINGQECCLEWNVTPHQQYTVEAENNPASLDCGWGHRSDGWWRKPDPYRLRVRVHDVWFNSGQSTTLDSPWSDWVTIDPPLPVLPALTNVYLSRDLSANDLSCWLNWSGSRLVEYEYEVAGRTLLLSGSNYGWIPSGADRARVRAAYDDQRGPWSEWLTMPPESMPTITGLRVELAEDNLYARLVWDDADWSFNYEWEDDSVYSNTIRMGDDWHLKRRWHDFEVRLRVRANKAGCFHGEWAEWVTVPARSMPAVIGLRVETDPNPDPDSDSLVYARLVWDNREPEIGYQVEFVQSRNIYDLNEAGMVMRTNAPTPVWVRSAVQGREGPWSELVWLPPDLSPAPPQEPEPFSRVHLEPGAGFATATEPCNHPALEVLRSQVYAGRLTQYLRCEQCGARFWVDEQTGEPVPPATRQYESFAEDAERLIETHRRIRDALNQHTTATTWIVTRNGAQLAATRRHETELAAIDEAERLARKERAVFLVWQLVGQVEPAEAPLRWFKASDLPF